MRARLGRAVLATGMLLGTAFGSGPALAQAQTQIQAQAQADDGARTFGETGYSVADDAIWSFFSEHGGVATFGAPISREFEIANLPVQLFQNAALQLQPDGSVQVLPMTGDGWLPFTRIDGLTLPAADQALAFVAPTSDQPNYASRAEAFLQATVPDSFNGQPVQFYSTYVASGGADVWGMPTSFPAADPNNPNFIYQRFQNGVLMFDATAGTTQALPLGSYLEAVLTGQNLPADLASEAASSPLLRLGVSNGRVSDAFVPDAS